uniref:Uncharacterized protein n=1 Tax=Arundo donax TaxID=35708 RepID=A0A0A9I0J6_ARUDO
MSIIRKAPLTVLIYKLKMGQLRRCPYFVVKLQICPHFLGFVDLPLFFQNETDLCLCPVKPS